MPFSPEPPDFPLEAPPGPSILSDGTLAALKIGLSVAIPGAGALISESLGAIVTYRNNKATTDWLEKLQMKVEQNAAILEHLQDPQKAEEFVAATLSACQAALRTHQEEKRIALRSAVLNTALAGNEGADERMIFIRFIDELTPSHLLILRIFRDAGISGDSEDTEQIMENCRKRGELPYDRDSFKLLLQDLQSRWLIVGDGASDTKIRTHDGIVRFTEVGRRFLKFIEEPEPKA